jgi:hypothetical protein
MSNVLDFVNTKTVNGFDNVLFKDFYDAKCSLQISSIATDDCIWLGIDDANPQIMTKDAIKFGLISEEESPHNCYGEPCGWIPFRIPKEVFCTTRMHLNKEQCFQLAQKLLQFAYSGKIISK